VRDSLHSTQMPDVGELSLPRQERALPSGQEFAGIYHREFSYVWHTLRRLGVPHRELADVAQNVFIIVYSRFDLYDPSRPLRPWLFGVSFRVAADYMRLARHAREMVRDDIEVTFAGPAADEVMSQREDDAMLREALDALDLDRRAVLVAHDFDGTTGPEIADALGIPLKTMYYRLRTGREQFIAAVRRVQARQRCR
jgi:RNA polymerase sigma-70 factor, ECF subfamily